MKRIHFVGIGGIGMSALARYFLSLKWAVSGSDAVQSSITKALAKEAVKVKIGHKTSNLTPYVDLVVISQAIRPENPELKEAKRRGIRVLTYPEAIGELTRQYDTIAIAGAHGKSTTTALSAITFIAGGLDPTVIVGTNLNELRGKNFRRGRSKYLILEADEFGRAFLNYSPIVSIVTNIDREHLDVYNNLATVKKNFIRFLTNTRSGGTLILNRDDKNLRSLWPAVTMIAQKKDLRVVWYSIMSPAAKKIKKTITIFGEHNLSNATAAYELGRIFKLSPKKIVAAIASYRGAWRRMEFRGGTKLGDHAVKIFDDYAHHPTEIKATLRAFRAHFPKPANLVCVFQPHQAKRLDALFKEFQTAFHDADAVIILPLYKVTGRDETIARDSEALVKAMRHRHPKKPFLYVDDPRKLKATIPSLLTSHSILIMMGAGNIFDYTESLLS